MSSSAARSPAPSLLFLKLRLFSKRWYILQPYSLFFFILKKFCIPHNEQSDNSRKRNQGARKQQCGKISIFSLNGPLIVIFGRLPALDKPSICSCFCAIGVDLREVLGDGLDDRVQGTDQCWNEMVGGVECIEQFSRCAHVFMDHAVLDGDYGPRLWSGSWQIIRPRHCTGPTANTGAVNQHHFNFA